MIPSIPYFFVGYRILTVCREHAADLLNICRIHALIYEDFQNTEDGGISLRFPRPAAKRAEMLCREHGIPVSVRGEGGLPHLFSRLIDRAGLVVGAVLGLLLLIVAQSVIWDIRISGNEGLSDHAIEETLAACGFSVGTSRRGFEADKLENNVLMLDDRLAWISVNRKGTVAYVEVREKIPRPASESDSPCDIVASIGGVIQWVELEEGNVRVSAGQLVGEGEVLVSGLYDSTQQGIRFTAAKAKVYARTTRELTVTIPLSYEQKNFETDIYTTKGEICQEKFLNFFGNHIKFSKKTGNMAEFCDIIENEKS
ncbi:MAG: sporulation protein YqfD [Clostridia bacterium]|nr:sporulation protein YqfD [Clostridia bacterium]